MCVESQGFGKFSSISVLLKITSKRGYVKIFNSLHNGSIKWIPEGPPRDRVGDLPLFCAQGVGICHSSLPGGRGISHWHKFEKFPNVDYFHNYILFDILQYSPAFYTARFLKTGSNFLLFYFYCSIVFIIILYKKWGLEFLILFLKVLYTYKVWCIIFVLHLRTFIVDKSWRQIFFKLFELIILVVDISVLRKKNMISVVSIWSFFKRIW